MNIEDLEITIRSHSALNEAGIETVEQLVNLSWEQLNSIKSIGEKSVTEICWLCLQVLNGRMTAQRIEWEKRWPSHHVKPENWREIKAKAKKYDKIAAIVGAQVQRQGTG